jgi:hypothetical protein
VAFNVGDWVEITRAVGGRRPGTRGKVTRADAGSYEVSLTDGYRVGEVPADALRHTPGAEVAAGCGVVVTATIGAVTAALAAWARWRTGL